MDSDDVAGVQDTGSDQHSYSADDKTEGLRSDTNEIPKQDELAAATITGNTDAPPQKKISGKLKKAPDAPKRFKSAFIFFSTEKHKEIRGQLGEKGISEKTGNISKLVAEAWRELTLEDKEKWEVMARNDRTRYDMEKSIYQGPWHVPKERKPKDANAPKRPMSAFLAFANSRRASVKRDMPGASNGDVSRALAAMWKAASDDVRQRYIDEEHEKRQTYKAAMSEWKETKEEEKRLERRRREEMALRLAEEMDANSRSSGHHHHDSTSESTHREDYAATNSSSVAHPSYYSMSDTYPYPPSYGSGYPHQYHGPQSGSNHDYAKDRQTTGDAPQSLTSLIDRQPSAPPHAAYNPYAPPGEDHGYHPSAYYLPSSAYTSSSAFASSYYDTGYEASAHRYHSSSFPQESASRNPYSSVDSASYQSALGYSYPGQYSHSGNAPYSSGQDYSSDVRGYDGRRSRQRKVPSQHSEGQHPPPDGRRSPSA